MGSSIMESENMEKSFVARFGNKLGMGNVGKEIN